MHIHDARIKLANGTVPINNPYIEESKNNITRGPVDRVFLA
jgi:hypothetical protein